MRLRLIALLTAAVLIAAACGDDDDAASTTTAADGDPPTTEGTGEAAETGDGTTTSGGPSTTGSTTSDDTTTAPASTTPAPSSGLPETPVQATVAQAYRSDGLTFDAAELQLEPGLVEASWYRLDGRYVVVYRGLPPDGEFCPGNSLEADQTFLYISNDNMPAADCAGIPTLADPTDQSAFGVQICDGVVSYVTVIPDDSVGRLYASIEKPIEGGVVIGITGVADTAAGEIPEVTLDQLSC